MEIFFLCRQDLYLLSETDEKGIIRFANDEFCKFAGYKLEELIGATPLGKDRAVTMPVLVEINNPSFSDPTIRQTYNTELQEIKKNLQKALMVEKLGLLVQ